MNIVIWKTIEVGNFTDKNQLLEAIKAKGSEPGYGIGENIAGGDWPEHQIAKIIIAQESDFVLASRQSLDLVLFEVSELIGEEVPMKDRYKMACEKAKELGLGLCPPSVGPELYLQGVDKKVCVGMDPIFASHTFTGYCSFSVSPKLLGVYNSGNDNYPKVGLKTKIAFVRPR
jgi:hypothetical protein